ncbi:phage tail protein I [Grimontia hollisae]|uniref:phage tail protein I n=1 Tax=Grimontia hollisae TaxID=673 RepID=UPI0013037610|nr:phage tail protein I [Grimontia hollisae]
MSSPPDFVSAQPENRSTLEEALEYAWHAVIEHGSSPYPTLKQPLQTPEAFVALLAGERGVLDWQPEDSPEQQRRTAHHAFDIHRKAGTRDGLKTALDVLDCDLDITPWHQMENPPGPYHIEVIAWRRNSPISKSVNERIAKRINSIKSERDTVEVIPALGLHSGFTFAGVAHRTITHQEETVSGIMPDDTACGGSLNLCGASYMVAVSDFSPGARA